MRGKQALFPDPLARSFDAKLEILSSLAAVTLRRYFRLMFLNFRDLIFLLSLIRDFLYRILIRVQGTVSLENKVGKIAGVSFINDLAFRREFTLL